MKNNNIKFSWSNYWSPTPKNIRKAADSILAGATIAATFSMVKGYDHFAVYIMITSVIAKVVSNFFKDEIINE